MIVFIRFLPADYENVSESGFAGRLDIADLNFKWRMTNAKASFEPL
jgi:hypothetical protein